jgi:outer membrane immunogenic protein
MKKILIAGIVLGTFAAGSALAADLPRPAPAYKAPVAAPMFNWSGFYIGLHAGYAWGDSDWTNTVIPGGAADDSLSPEGHFVGAQIGYNWQVAPQWVWGIEADISHASVHDRKNGPGIAFPAFDFGDEIDMLGTVRLRAGYAVDRTLWYVTGGWAWADGDRDLHVTTVTDRSGLDHSGWTIGAGVEHAITHNWTLKAEYLYMDLGDKTFVSPTLVAGAPWNVELQLHSVRFGVNYKF